MTYIRSLFGASNSHRLIAVVGLAMCFLPRAAGAQDQPESISEPLTRAPGIVTVPPAPEVMQAMFGTWQAKIPDGYGGEMTWRLDLQDDGQFQIEVIDADGQANARAGAYEVDARSVRLIYPGQANEADPNSTALNLSDAHSFETYFYRLLENDRLAFRPTLCRIDPCQWIADRLP